ncbi:hypothetical protein BKA69DRAFT_250773 [Paraphysoderma sedebokerense]|nr:hypothetical protein BKA69DRAFT_250773 [Paraphysoderma sedebokerense]
MMVCCLSFLPCSFFLSFLFSRGSVGVGDTPPFHVTLYTKLALVCAASSLHRHLLCLSWRFRVGDSTFSFLIAVHDRQSHLQHPNPPLAVSLTCILLTSFLLLASQMMTATWFCRLLPPSQIPLTCYQRMNSSSVTTMYLLKHHW